MCDGSRGDVFDDAEDVFGGIAVMEDDREVEFAGKKKLVTENVLLLLFEGLVPIVIKTYLTDSDEFVTVRTDSGLDGVELFAPIGFDVFRMQAESRETKARMSMTDIKDGRDGGDVDAGDNHSLDATLFLPQNDFFTVLVKSGVVDMAMGINHLS